MYVEYEVRACIMVHIRISFNLPGKRQLNLRDTQDGSGWPGLCAQLYIYAMVKWYPK